MKKVLLRTFCFIGLAAVLLSTISTFAKPFIVAPGDAILHTKALTDATFNKVNVPAAPVKSRTKRIATVKTAAEVLGGLSVNSLEPTGSGAFSPFSVTQTSVCPQGIATVTFSGSIIQSFQVPAGVTSVNIKAIGANGGSDLAAHQGGTGAVIAGTFAVTSNEFLYIIAGQKGVNEPSFATGFVGAGGGGGTFVSRKSSAGTVLTPSVNPADYTAIFTNESDLLIAAGGGGGGGYGTVTIANPGGGGNNDMDANTIADGNYGYVTNSGAYGAGGNGGAQGITMAAAAQASGGGTGFKTGGFVNGNRSGRRPADNAAGGFQTLASIATTYGGYGGGGGIRFGSGGGGGYSGGGGGGSYSSNGSDLTGGYFGGGGGSYIGTATNVTKAKGVGNTFDNPGNGIVVITWTIACANPLVPGSIGSDQAICSGQAASAFTSTAASGGTGTITYQWQSSTDNVSFNDISGATSETYSPGTLTQTTYYRRGAKTSADAVQYTNAVTVTVNPLPTVTGTLSGCVGSNTTLTGSGTAAAVNPWVSSNSSVLTVSNLGVVSAVAAGNASITYTNSNGCSKSVIFTVTAVPSAPSVSVNNNCDGTSTLSTTATGSLLWSTGATTSSITVNTAGTYTVTTTVNGCTSAAGSGVAAPGSSLSAPVVTVVDNCDGTSTLSTTAPGTLLWSTGATTSSITVNAAGTYTVTQTSGSCVSAPGSGVAAPKTTPTISGISGTLTICSGNNTVLTASSSAFSPTFKWYNNPTYTTPLTINASLNTFALSATTTYYAEVINAQGCVSTRIPVTVTVNPSPVMGAISGTLTICSGTSTAITASSSASSPVFKWYDANNGGNLLYTGVTYTTPVLTASANYYVSVTSNGCSSLTTPVAVTVSSQITPTFTQVAAVCSGTSFTLPGTSTNGISGSWSPAVNTTTTTTYTFTPDAGQCATTSSMTVTVKPIPSTPTVSVVDNCNGTSTLSTTATGSLLWSTGETTSSITVNTAGTYRVTTTVNGCTSAPGSGVASPKTTPSAPTVNVVDNCNGTSTLSTTATGTLLWSTGETTSSITVNTAGTYRVTTTVNGCTSAAGSGVASPKTTPSAPTVSVVDNCNGTSTLSTTATGTLLWSTGETTSSITVNTAGTYRVTTTVNGCTSAAGSGVASPKTAPSVFTVTGGGSYCAGSGGVSAGLSGSVTGVSYQLFNGASPVGSPMAGTGSAISFGNQATAGTYTVSATNAALCAATMGGSVVVTVTPLPTVATVTNQVLCANLTTNAISFSGTGTNYSWTNTNTSTGLAGSGSGDIASFTALNTTGSPVTSSVTVTPTSGGESLVYIGGSHQILAINTLTNTVVKTISNNANAEGVALSPDGSRFYVAQYQNNSVGVFNTSTGGLITAIPVANQPVAVAVSPDGSRVYAVSHGDNTLYTINASTNIQIGSPLVLGTTTYPNNWPAAVTTSPDGSKIYVGHSGFNAGGLTIVDATTHAITKFSLPTGNSPNDIIASSDGNWVYLSCLNGNITAFNTGTNALSTIAIGAPSAGLALSPDGSLLYASNPYNGRVYVVNTTTQLLQTSIPVGTEPWGISITPDGKSLYVINASSYNVSVINTATNTVAATVATTTGMKGVGRFISPAAASCTGIPTTFTITVNPLPVATITVAGSTTICNGGSVVLTASAGSSYLWSNGATTQSITVSTAGSYHVRVTNEYGCSATSADKTVTVTPAPSTPTVSVVDNCNGTSTLSTTATGSLLWSTTETTSSIIVNTAGTYSVTQTVNGCVSAAGSGAASPKATPSAPTVSVVDNCNGTSTLSTTATGTLLWSTGATTSSVTVNTAGTYTVTTTVNGCTSAAGSGVASPKTTPSAPAVSVVDNCNGTSTLSTTATGTLLWSTGATTSAITVNTAGTYTVTQTINGCTSVAGSGVASPNSTPTAPAVSVVDNCDGTSTLSTTATGVLLWSTGATTSSITVNTAGTYTVTATLNGCTSPVGSGVAAPKTTPTISGVTGTLTVCSGSGTSLTASSAASSPSFKWYSSVNGVTPMATAATLNTGSLTITTTYYVEVISNGCVSARTAVTVTVTPRPAAVAYNVTAFCSGVTIITAANVTGSIVWNTGETTNTISVTTAGTFSATQTENGCSSLPSSIVVSAPKTTPPTPAVTVVDNCNGTSTLSTTASPVLWNNGATTQTITVSIPGTYTVTSTVNGCTSAAGSGVAAPKATPSAPLVSVVDNCNGTSTLSTTAPGSLLWSTGETTSSITVSSAGTYTVTRTVNGCVSAAGSAVASPKTTPSAPTVSVVNNCDGTSTLSTTATGALLWSTGATTSSITVNTAGTYSVTTTVNGCVSAAGSGVASPKTTPSAVITAGGVTTFCEGGSVVLTSGSATGNVWSTGETTQSITVTTSGNYSVAVTANGCSATSNTISVTVNPLPAVPVISVPPTICWNMGGLPVTVSPAGGVWSSSDPSVAHIYSDASATVLIGGSVGTTTITYTVTNGSGCASSASQVVTSLPTPNVGVITGVSTICTGSTAQLSETVSGGVWSILSGAGNASIDHLGNVSGIQPGNVTVSYEVTGSNGCSFNATFQLTVNATPSTPSVSVVDNCNGTSTLSATAIGSLLWSTGETTSSITVNTAGTYTVTSTIGSCTSAAGSGVASPKTTPSAPIVHVVDNCDGTSTLSTTVTGSLVWSTGATASSITVHTSGTYTVTTTVNGCTSAAGSGVASPKTTPSTPTVSVVDNCNGTSTLSTTATGTLLWSTGATTSSITVNSAGTYTVTTTVNACPSAAGSGVASPKTTPSAPTVSVVDNCNGTSTLSTTATGSLLWSTGATTSSITVNTAGTYTVTTTVNGCTSAAGSGVAAPKATPATPTISVTGPTTVCPGATVYLTSSAATGNVWSNGATTQSIFVTASGSYTVTVTVNGCASAVSAPIVITVQDITPPATPTLATITAECSATAPLATTLDACSGAITGTTSDPLTYHTQGDHVIHWTFTDASNNSTTADQHVIIHDVTLPSITCPQTITLSATTTVDGYGANATYTATATDNCSTPAVTYSPASGSFFTPGTHVVTATANDGNGNTATCQFNVIVIAPEINITGNSVSIVDGDVTPSAADHTNFGSTLPGSPITRTFTIQNLGNDNLNVSSIAISGVDAASFTLGAFSPAVIVPGGSITFDVTFLSNTVGTRNATVTVGNNDFDESSYDFAISADINCSTPVFTACSSNITTNTDLGLCSAVVPYTTTVTGIPAPALTYTFTGATTGTGSGNGSGSVFNKGTTTVNVTATNSCGTATCTFTITVVDNERPVIHNTPANITKSNDAGQCGATATWVLPTATDNCPVVTLTSDHHSGDVFPVGTTTVTYTATDAAGHTVTTSFTVTVTDNENPIIITPSDVSHTADAGRCSYTFTTTDNGNDNGQTPGGGGPGNGSSTPALLLVATATDNCGVVTVAGVRSDALPLDAAYPVGSTTITWTASDSHGHSVTGTSTVTITDDEFPVIIGTPAAIHQSADANACGAVVNWTLPTATDNCAATLTSDHHSGDVFPIGTTTVTYTAVDPHGHTTTTHFDVTITDNQAPVIACHANITVSGEEGQNGAHVTYTVTATDNCGTPTLTYDVQPGSLFPIGTTPVTVTVVDANGLSSTCVFNVTVLNNPPVANPDVNTTPEDTPVSANVLPNDTDVDGNGLTVTGFTINSVTYAAGATATIAEGTLVINANGSYTFTPAPDFNGNVPVATYTITDTNGGTASSTLTITVTPVNDGPVANPDVNTTPEDTPVSANVLPNDSDIDGDALVVTGFVINGTPYTPGTIAVIPGIGDLVINANGSYTYTPAPNYNGPVPVVTYTISDGHGGTASSTLTINVTPVNDVPVAVNDAVSTNEDTPVSGTVTGNDTPSGDGGNTWSVVTTTTHGTLVFNTDGTYTYTPNANYNGTDAFTYKVCDVDGDCATATVTITIVPVNDVPYAVNDAVSTNEDTPVSGTVTGNDTPSGDGGNTWSVVTTTTHGTLVFHTDGTYTYTPNANYNGTDAFTYKVCDVDGDCATATVTITIVPVNDVPYAVNDAVSTNEDTPVSGTVTGNDTPSGDGGNTWSVVTTTTHGTLVFNTDGTYTYTPNANYNGPDAFTYKVCDVDGDCATATVNITVIPVNDVPVAVNDAETVNEDAVLTSTVVTNDAPSGDGGNTWSVVTTTTHGTLVFNPNGSYTYTPNANYNGPDAFTYKVCDVDGDCSTATVTITVIPMNDVPVAVNDAVSTNEDTPVSGSVTGNDTPSPDGGNVWSVVTTTTHGTLVFHPDGSYTYTPNTNYNGPDAFTYKVCDVNGDCSTATVTITVIPVDDPAVIKVKNITVYVDPTGHVSITPGQIDDGSYDPDGIASITLNKTNFDCSDIASSPNTVTLTVTDVNGNSMSANATVTVLDIIPPTIVCPAPVTVQCASAVPAPNTALVTAADNCSAVISFVGDVISNQTAPNKYTITRTYKAVDPSGNSATCTQLITVNDNTAPTLTVAGSLPGNATGQCLAGVPAAPSTASIAALYTDNCSGAVTAVLTNTTTTGTNAAGWVRKYYYTITDASGNTTTACVTYSGRDTQAPVPTSATLPTVSGQCSASVTAPTATDNCAGTITATTLNPTSYSAQGTYTITWTYSDGNGNTSSQTQTVVVKDNIAPVINCPSNITVVANTTVSGQAGANVTYTVTATDNCGTPTITYSKVSGTFFPVGTTAVTATANDGNGNTSSCTFNVTVTCVTPVFTTCPTNKSVSTDPGVCTAVVTYTSAATGTPSAACTYAFSGATTGSGAGNGSGKTFNKGVTTVTITAANLCGTATCSFTVTVADNENPVIVNVPANITKTNDAGVCGAVTTWTAPTASDNCPGVTLASNYPSGTLFPVGTTTVTYTATDAGGRSVTGSFTVTVTDAQPPVITCPGNITLPCGSATTPANAGTATAVDNCGGSVTITYTDVISGSVTTRTWKATDAAGNSSTCTQTITIGGPFVSTITSVPTSNVYTGAGIPSTTLFIGYGAQSTVLQTNVPTGSTYTYVWSGSDAAMLSSTTTAAPVFTPTRGGSFAFTVTVTNALGCKSTASVTICVTDIRVFAAVTNNNDDDDDHQGMCNHQAHSASDCPHKGHNHTCNHRSHSSYSCAHRNTNDRDDDDDNEKTCDHKAHSSSDCSHRGHNHATCNHQAHSASNCPHGKSSGGSSDQKVCNHQAHNSNDCNHCGHNHSSCNHRAHSAADCPHSGGHGGTDDDADVNKVYICHKPSSGSSQTLTVNVNDVAAHLANHAGDRLGSCDQAPCTGYTDNVKPVIDCSDNVTIAYGASTSPAATGSPEADDNSGDVNITYTDASTKGTNTASANYYNYTITRTWKAADLAGNFSTCAQVITVQETTKPVISCPAAKTVGCGSIAPAVTGTATATDNSGVVTVTYSDVFVGNKTTRTWKATDPSGNYVTCTQTITVVDNEAPLLTEPNDITVNCGSSTAPSATGTATATDNCSTVNITYSDVTSSNKITRTWKATDASGNYATDVQVITIVDLVKPTIAAPADMTVSCSASTAPTSCGGNATASDNCSSVTITYSDVKVGNVISRTWKATDASGNYNTDVQTITIADNTKPVLYVPSHISVNCGSSTTPSGCNSSATATDNCSTPVISYTDETSGNLITRTWKATDAAGNFTTGTQTITIVDNVKPVLTEPNDITISCGASTLPAATGNATATDNCSTPVISYTDAISGNKITRTWKATDASGNYSTDIQIITMTDNVKPVLTEPNDITVSCGASTLPAATGTATATDNCSTPVISYTDVISGSKITRTWKATDATGNYITAAQIITIVDNVKPVIAAPADITVSCGASTVPSSCGGGATASDNCSSVTITYSDVTAGNKITRTWKATDASGNFNTDVQVITIVDNTKPVLTEPNDITINCGASILPATTGNATASDNCSSVTITYSDVTAGNKITRTWKAADASGNYVTDVQVITIAPSFTASVTSVPTNSTYTGGVSTNLYLGYGAQSTTLSMCSLPSSGAPYTYVWTSTYANRLNSTTVASPVFTPTAFGYYTFNVTVTNKYGCTSTESISICVTDIRVPGTNGAKVYVCHTTSGKYGTSSTLQVAINQVASHLAGSSCGGNGSDRLGSCDQSPCNTTVSNSIVSSGTKSGMTKEGDESSQVITSEEELKVTVMPNPTTTFFTLKLESKFETPVNMRVMDGQGRVVDAKSKIGANSTIQIGHNYSSGTYYAELIQGNTRKVVQMIKGRG